MAMRFTRFFPLLLKIFSLIVVVLALAPACGATTWYVAPTASGGNDANPGTLAQPFYTLGPAVSKAQPGDTVYMRGGTYPYTSGQFVSCSGTASAWITISAYPGETPVVNGSSMPSAADAIDIGGQYLVIQGLTVQNSPSGGIESWQESHLHILDNNVSGSVSFGIYCGAATFGTSGDILISGNTVDNNCQVNNPPCQNCGWPSGISVYYATGATIANNNSYQNFGEGIDSTHSDDISMLENQSHDNYSVEIYLDNAQFCTVGANLAYSTFNTIYYRFGDPAVGIQCANENFVASINPLNSDVIVNNVVINGRYDYYYGNYENGGGMKNFIVANNTFYGALDTLFYIDSDPGHLNNLIANNIFYQTNGDTMEYMGGPVSAFSFSHNAWYGGSSGPCAGTGDVIANPLLVNPGTDTATDYDPQPGSPLIDAGTAVAAVTSDYLGVSRPQGPAYDIGAFEMVVPTPTITATPNYGPATLVDDFENLSRDGTPPTRTNLWNGTWITYVDSIGSAINVQYGVSPGAAGSNYAARIYGNIVAKTISNNPFTGYESDLSPVNPPTVYNLSGGGIVGLEF